MHACTTHPRSSSFRSVPLELQDPLQAEGRGRSALVALDEAALREECPRRCVAPDLAREGGVLEAEEPARGVLLVPGKARVDRVQALRAGPCVLLRWDCDYETKLPGWE